jgi:2-dehydropantoate 2-reductase
MKVCIVGLGAIGGLLAAWLVQRTPPGQVQVSALARGATLAAVQQQGLGLHTETGITYLPLQASHSAAALGVQDLVIVAVKGPALAAVAPAIAQLCGPHTTVMSAMNGVPWWFFDGQPGPCQGLVLQSVDAGGAVRAQLASTQVLGCVVHLSSTQPAPGQVRHINGTGLIVGAATQPSAVNETAVAALLTQAGFTVTVSPHIQREVWFKLWGNMTMNPVSALTGAASDRVLDDELVRGFITAVMLEAQALGAAMGLPIEQTPQERHHITRKLGSFKTSMLQDTLAGRPLEIDALVAAVREIGVHLGQATPFMDALLGLVRLMAREKGLYPPAP